MALFLSATVVYQTPQLDLWQSKAVEWHLIKRLPDYAPRQHKHKAVSEVVQVPLPEFDAR